MAFRYSGVNWAGIMWHVAGAIETLGNQIEKSRGLDKVYPEDGTVASYQHDQNNPNSDHRPDDQGIVRAIDWGGPPDWQNEVAENLRVSRDPRIKYLIHNKRLFSSYKGPNSESPFTWRPYGGYNLHLNHTHVSVVSGALGESTSEWEIEMAQLTQEEVRVVQEITGALKNMGSNGTFAEGAVKIVRVLKEDQPDLGINEIVKHPVPLETGISDLEKDLNMMAKALEDLKNKLRSV
jgi:enamine deaminase RidA (YjgF/YER057c/UK114 family)